MVLIHGEICHDPFCDCLLLLWSEFRENDRSPCGGLMQFPLPELTLIIPAAEDSDLPFFRIDEPGKIFPVYQDPEGHPGGCHLV